VFDRSIFFIRVRLDDFIAVLDQFSKLASLF
jgi:hypothetical protein